MSIQMRLLKKNPKTTQNLLKTLIMAVIKTVLGEGVQTVGSVGHALTQNCLKQGKRKRPHETIKENVTTENAKVGHLCKLGSNILLYGFQQI